MRTEQQVQALLVLCRRWPTYEADGAKATRAIIQAAAVALGVERASIWLLSDDGRALVCEDLYEASRHRHSTGFKIVEGECPAYFAALHTEGWIVATDARNDPRTECFAGSYLDPHGIGAILDMPIRVGGRVAGVLRLEHVGGVRIFQTDEQVVASHLASLASLSAQNDTCVSAAADVQRAKSALAATADATGAAVLILNRRGSVVHYNERVLELWGMDESLMGPAGDNGVRMEFVANQMPDPARFIARYRRISADEEEPSDDVLTLADGRRIERRSAPQRIGGEVVGRAWTFRELDGG